ERQQLSMPGSLSENSVWHNGRDVWTWESEGHKVTHLLLPADRAQGAEATNAAETEAVPTPDALAKQLLDDLNPSTAVSVTTPAYVADRAVYELVLSPRSPDSTVDHLAMAVDAANGMPLRVQAWAKGQEKAALQLGFTSISYGKPAGSFTFKPPPGSAVTTKDLTKDHADGPARTERHAAHTPDQADAN